MICCNQQLYVPFRFTTGASGWIVIGKKPDIYLHILYRSKVKQPDVLKHNEMTHFET